MEKVAIDAVELVIDHFAVNAFELEAGESFSGGSFDWTHFAT
jgi:hypothetical protein